MQTNSEDCGFSKSTFYKYLETMCGDENLSKKIDLQLVLFKKSKGLFGCSTTKLTRNEKSPADWWDSFGDDTPELKQFAIRVLSLTYSSSGCERNWSAFEMKMNDLVYVMYNLKLSGKEERKRKEEDLETFYFEDVDFDDEWITKENKDLTNVYKNESTTHGDSEDDDFLEEAIRNQYGGNEQSREESIYVFEEENEQEEKRIEEEQADKAQDWKLPVCYDDDDDEESSNSLQDNIIFGLPPCSAVTPSEPVDSLSMRDEHLDTIPATESDEFIKSCVENLVPNPSESEGENGCDLPACFTTFSNILFDDDYEFDYVDNQLLHNEDFSEKIFSNPLFEEEIISIKKNQHHFIAESDLVESILNRDSSIIFSSSKIDSHLDEFVGELTLLKSILPRIDKADCHPENEIRLSQRLLYDNSSPRPPKEFNSENSNADIESFSPSPIPIKDSDSHMEEIDLSFNLDDPMLPSIEDDDNNSEGDNLFLERLLHDDPIPLPDTLDFSNVVRVFLPFFTYPVTSSILLSPGSEDTIFNPGITINRCYSFLAGFISSVWNF
nr:zf-BED domain-containing protein [Tanacetum cinerariifolium]